MATCVLEFSALVFPWGAKLDHSLKPFTVQKNTDEESHTKQMHGLKKDHKVDILVTLPRSNNELTPDPSCSSPSC